jgi:hypothetical protein
MFLTFKEVISRGGFNLSSILKKIDVYHVEGKLTDDERTILRSFALDNADVENHPEYAAIVERVKAQLGLTEEEDPNEPLS